MENTKRKSIYFPTTEGEQVTPDNASLEKAYETIRAGITDFMQTFAQNIQIENEFITVVESVLSEFMQGIARLWDDVGGMKTVTEVLQQVCKSLAIAIKSVQVPDITEEQKQELINSYAQWGEFGWTFFPSTTMEFFSEPPVSLKDANERMKGFCTKQEITHVFELLRNQDIKKEDLESAIFCYENRQYKACALILFGIIDSKMFRVQDVKENRNVGNKAVTKIRQQFDGRFDLLFEFLFCTNLFSCLQTFFSNGNGFKKEPLIINRNFVSHGLNRRSVRKRDCIQLFLALNNFMDLLSYNIYRRDD